MPRPPLPRHSVTQPLDKPYRLIPLTQGQNAIVDAADFEWLSQWHWFAHWSKCSRSFYASRNVIIAGKRTVIRMHRALIPEGPEVDHKNGNTLDYRRDNLRPCTSSQNHCNSGKRIRNTSGYKGVTLFKQTGKWRAQIKVNGHNSGIGYFETPEEAARAYDEAAIRLHGEFARLNFPQQHQ